MHESIPLQAKGLFMIESGTFVKVKFQMKYSIRNMFNVYNNNNTNILAHGRIFCLFDCIHSIL